MIPLLTALATTWPDVVQGLGVLALLGFVVWCGTREDW